MPNEPINYVFLGDDRDNPRRYYLLSCPNDFRYQEGQVYCPYLTQDTVNFLISYDRPQAYRTGGSVHSVLNTLKKLGIETTIKELGTEIPEEYSKCKVFSPISGNY